MRIIERRDGTGFALEAIAEFFGGDFDGDGAVEPRIAGTVYFAHPARAQRGENLVRAEAGTGGERHISRLYLN